MVVDSTVGSFATSLTFASISRAAGTHGLLLFDGGQGSAGVKEQLFDSGTVPMDSTGRIVAPYMLYGGGGSNPHSALVGQNAAADFMTYSGGSGFAQFTGYQTGSDLSLATTASVMNLSLGTATAINNSPTLVALKITNTATGTSLVMGGAGTVTLSSGGLINATNIATTISAGLNFNGVEGVVYNAGSSLTISGVINNASGLTFGANLNCNAITISNTANSFSGPITVNNCRAVLRTGQLVDGRRQRLGRQHEHHAQRRHAGPQRRERLFGFRPHDHPGHRRRRHQRPGLRLQHDRRRRDPAGQHQLDHE